MPSGNFLYYDLQLLVLVSSSCTTERICFHLFYNSLQVGEQNSQIPFLISSPAEKKQLPLFIQLVVWIPEHVVGSQTWIYSKDREKPYLLSIFSQPLLLQKDPSIAWHSSLEESLQTTLSR